MYVWYVYVCMYVCLYVCMYVCVCMYLCVCVYVYVWTHMQQDPNFIIMVTMGNIMVPGHREANIQLQSLAWFFLLGFLGCSSVKTCFRWSNNILTISQTGILTHLLFNNMNLKKTDDNFQLLIDEKCSIFYWSLFIGMWFMISPLWLR